MGAVIAACLASPGHEDFNPALKNASGDEDAVLASKRLHTYICPHSHHLPFITAAGMFLLQPDNVTQFDFHSNERIVPSSLRIVE